MPELGTTETLVSHPEDLSLGDGEEGHGGSGSNHLTGFSESGFKAAPPLMYIAPGP